MAVEGGYELISVTLEKTSAKQSFGIRISGGKGNPHFKTGDTSIFVTDIEPGSPSDGVLKAADILISVNETLVDGRTHNDAVNALRAAGMQARLEIKRTAPKAPKSKIIERNEHLAEAGPSNSSTPRGSPKTESDRGRARKKPREMEQESGVRHRSSRSRSRNREEGEHGEKPRRSRSRSKNREGEDGEKPRRSHSKNRGEDGDKPRRSRSRGRDSEEKGDGEQQSHSRGRSKSRSRDDLTRSKSKESLHRSKSKSRENLNGLPPGSEFIDIVLERGQQGYGFSLVQHISIKDLAPNSPASNAEKLEKGDIVDKINGVSVNNLKISECIEIIKAATEQLTLTVVKKPKETKVTDQADSQQKNSKPTRPAEAPEAEIIPKVEKQQHHAPEPKQEEIERHREPEPPHEPERKREPSPPPDGHDDRNDTKDSWAAASPEKQRYSSNDAHPNQEVEHFDAKMERLKAGQKFERRMSELPNARVISFYKTGSVGIQVAGGNALGIFVAAIRPDSAAAKEGLKPGDQIIMCNEIDFEDITREEAVLILLALPDDVTLIAESKKDTFEKIKKELGDNFFIRVNFDHIEKANANELVFYKGEIFNVRDTMYQGLIGYWQAQRVGKNASTLERGVLPNKSRAEQLSMVQKVEEKLVANRTSNSMKVKRKGSTSGTLKKHKFVSQDRLDESSFAEGVRIPAYERVVLKVADFLRPVIILGALGDLVRLKLVEEMPDRFAVPTPMDTSPSYDASIKLSEIRNVIAKNKHCLLDITPEGIEMLMYAQLCPIVILLKSPSKSAVKDMRVSFVRELQISPTPPAGFDHDPFNAKEVKRFIANAEKLEEFYPHIFTAKINTHIAHAEANKREFYIKMKEIIFQQQSQSAWMPEEKPADLMDDMTFHAPNVMSYASGVDSDTEGESMSSSPTLPRKYVDDESPLPSPTDDAAFLPPAEPEPKKHRERSKDRRRDREGSSDRENRRGRSKDKKSDHHHEKRDVPVDSPPEFKPEDPPYREPVREDYREPPRNEYRDDYREPPQNDYRDDYREPPKNDYRDDYREPRREYRDDHREHPRNDYRDEYRSPPRDDYRDYREPPPPVNREIQKTVEEHVSVQHQSNTYREPDDETTDFMYGRGPKEPVDEDIPVLRDPNYSFPKPVPDSPPSRRAPEVKPKPAVNAIKVFPKELKNEVSIEEKRRSLRKVPDAADDNPLKEYDDRAGVKVSDVWDIDNRSRNTPSPKRMHQEPANDLPPYRPPPPPEKEYVPTKVMTLQERMNKFQQKVTSHQPKPPPPPEDDELPPPARPAAPRNYIIDTRNRGSPRQDLYAQNTYKPSAQFPEVTRVTPKPKQVEETYMNVRNVAPIESTPTSRYPGDDEPQVIATARGVFDHRGGLLESTETNVSIYIPAGALPEGKKQEVYFKVCQDSKYMPPLDSHSGETLLSPLVMCGPHGLKFRKPIELRLPHKGASNDSMAFSLKSSDSPIGHPGHWKNVKLGGKDLDSGRAYQVTDDTVSVLVDHF